MNLIEFQLLKSRSGVYKDTPENRRKHRVGQRYGVQKVDEVVEIKNYFSQKVIPNVNSFQKASYGFANKFGIRVTSVNLKSVGCILLGIYIKPQPRALYTLIFLLLQYIFNKKNVRLHSEEVD